MSAYSRRRLLAIGCIGLAAPVLGQALAAEEVARRLALNGYDPVSYFTAGRPEKGSAEFAAPFDDATYWFVSAEHRAMFAADPDRYAPQYNGFCAVFVARGLKREIDPEAWSIMDGKLYVFASKKGVPIFEQQTASIIDQANENWRGLHKAP